MNRLALCRVYILHIWHVIENSSFCTMHKSSVSRGFGNHIVPILLVLCYNGSFSSPSYGTTDGRSACLSYYQAPIWGLWSDFYYCQLQICWRGPPTLRKGWFCSLQLFLGLSSAVILVSCRTHDRILLFQIWDSHNLGGQVPIFISLRNRLD
jgi:hypothetical protein